MSYQESLILDKINNSGKKSIEAEWLLQVYSPNLSIDLKNSLAERIGILSQEGWRLIKLLIKKYGVQAELIHAAGICHQPEARDWLLELIKSDDQFILEALNALKCWGGYLSKKFLKKLLSDPQESKQLAGLELLKFKAYQLSDAELLNLTEELLKHCSDNVMIATIKILQRRDSLDICNQLVKVAKTGSNTVVHACLIALGAIATESSYAGLIKLQKELPVERLRNQASKQINHQYRVNLDAT